MLEETSREHLELVEDAKSNEYLLKIEYILIGRAAQNCMQCFCAGY